MRILSHSILTLLWIIMATTLHAQQSTWSSYPTYSGRDLGLTFSKDSIRFRVWAPIATQAQLLYYKEATGGVAIPFAMKKSAGGTWIASLPFDRKGGFYTYKVEQRVKGVLAWSKEVTDPYGVAAGVNGLRSAIVNLRETDPEGWPVLMSSSVSREPIIIYELQIRDASKHESSGIKHKGKYLGLTERGTKNQEGLSTGIDHIKELGVTHVHLLPCFDFRSSDESSDHPPYNWGYDPLHYNLPEGTFATDVKDPKVRIIEFKKMVMTLHEAGLKVVMDVVYNHTAYSAESSFEQLAPDYYYRKKKDGEFSNASACGNETASERTMMRKFMLESLTHWVNEYNVDGFRFDLMGIHDIKTMNLISQELRKIRPDILLYGEGWTAGTSTMPDSLRAIKQQVNKLNGIAVFSDEFRDGIKGSVFKPQETGFVSGNENFIAAIQFGLKGGWNNPSQMIAYADCHDNHTLWDKLQLSNRERTADEIIEMQKLAFTLVLTSQGIPFIHAGSEFLRSKKGVENSFESPDSINAIDWSLKSAHHDVTNYVQALINLRKTAPEFWANSPTKNISFTVPNQNLLSYLITANDQDGNSIQLQVLFNGSSAAITLDKSALQHAGYNWKLLATNNKFLFDGEENTVGEKIEINPFSATIMISKD